jgi:aspartate/methionine/tyrosine aminotransferase
MRNYVSLSPGKLNDALAVLALRHCDRISERTQEIVRRNLGTANRWFAENSDTVSWTPPRGGLLALMRYAFDIPSLELADRLAEKYGVMLAPGSAFGVEHHLRIGIGQRPETFAEGLRRTAACLADLREEGIPLRRVSAVV